MKSPAGFFMAENPYSPSKPSKSLAERLGATGNKIAELSKQAATATKDAVSKVADAGKEADGQNLAGRCRCEGIP